MGQLNSKVPGLLTFLKPQPVLQISTGATAQLQGQFAYSIPESTPNDGLCQRGNPDAQNVSTCPGFLFGQLRPVQPYPESAGHILRDASPRPTESPRLGFLIFCISVLAELRLSHLKSPPTNTR